MTVIALYSRWYYLVLPVSLAIAVAMLWYAWDAPGFKVFFYSGFFVAVLALPFVAGLLCRQIYFRQRTAIWIEDSKLCFINSRESFRILRLPLQDIESFAIGPVHQNFRRGIDARLRTGMVWNITMEMLEDDRAVVLERLNALLPATPLH